MSAPSLRECKTCRLTKQKSEFPSPQAKRCAKCWAEADNAKCLNCQGPAGLCADKRTVRLFCPKPECQIALRRHNAAEHHAARTAARLAKTSHVCPACDVDKPLTEEFWTPLVRDADGTIARLDSYCRTCRYALKRDRYQSDESVRDYMQRKAAERRQRENEKRQIDPTFDQKIRAQRKAQSRRARALAQGLIQRPHNPAHRSPGGDRIDAKHFPALPSAPLAAAIMEAASRIEASSMLDNGKRLTAISAVIGVPPRSVWAWNAQERKKVQFDLAERILIALDLEWWQVWGDDPTARRAFEGVEVEA